MPMAIPATNVNQAHLPIDPKDRHRYTPNHIQEYFKRANLTQTQRNSPILSNSTWQEAKTTPHPTASGPNPLPRLQRPIQGP